MPEYQNPQQEPGMEKRLLLVFALTFLILLIFQPLLMKYAKPTPAVEKPEATQTAQPANVPSPAAVVAAEAKPAAAGSKQASSETQTVIENGLYRITFSNRGGEVKSWVLKQYKDEAGKPLELVHAAASAQYGYPLSLWTYDENLRKKLASALYVVNAEGTKQAPADITFEYADGETSVRKSFHFDDSYVVTINTVVEQKGKRVQAFPAWPAGFGDQATPVGYAAGTVDIYNGETNWHGGQKIERLAVKKISGGATINGPFAWAGAADQYFGAIFLPDDPVTAALVTLRSSIDVPKDPAKPDGEKIKEEVVGAAAGDTQGVTSERLFAGPKALGVLESIKAPGIAGQPASDLRNVVDFGTYLGFIARPLFLWLRWTHLHWVANWGWAIIVLTVIINVVLFPLRLSSMKAALKMQKVQPQVNAIKKKYEKYSLRDPRRQDMNQEISALFKQEGVNPAGGCLPMLIQFPFLVAFYSMLGVAIELRQANWYWIKDLSAADPLYILPIGIVITTLLVQKMTPQAGMDPAQQKVMTIFMPLMLGMISYRLSAGLGLYWTVGNLIAITQQFVMNRTSLGKEMRAEAEKRARKKEGRKA